MNDALSDADGTTIVMGHHPLFVEGVDRLKHYDGVNLADSHRLIEAMSAWSNVVACSAGHTYRCRQIIVNGISIGEVACVKDFPGAWAEYIVGSRGIAQIVHRASSPDAIEWAEKTRTMFNGYYGTFAMGKLLDRCFVLPLTR